jgi:hypothetical protein
MSERTTKHDCTGDGCRACLDALDAPSGTTGPADAPLSARWQELFWALPPGEMRSKLRALEIDIGTALKGAGPADAPKEDTHMSHGSTVPGNDSRLSPVAALVAKWRDEADGVTAMGYSQQGDRMRDCADELEAVTLADHLLEGLLKDSAWRQQWHSRLGRGETETEGKFYARMEGLTADRDEWREQHERLLAMYRASEAKLYGPSVAGPADAGSHETLTIARAAKFFRDFAEDTVLDVETLLFCAAWLENDPDAASASAPAAPRETQKTE